MRRRYPRAAVEENTYSLSISDLMTALLMIFILLTLYMSYELNRRYEENISHISSQRDKIDFINKQEELKSKVIDNLRKKLKEKGIKVRVDNKTGDVEVEKVGKEKKCVFFHIDDYKLQPKGKIFLKEFIPIYAEVLVKGDETYKQLARIVIVGHADNTGSYEYNMELSLKRAMSVARYIIRDMDFDFKERFKKKLLVGGRGKTESDNKTGEEYRNVGFKFRFVDWTTYKQMMKRQRGEKYTNKANNADRNLIK